MVVHQSKYHLVLQNGPGSKKVDGGDWGGDLVTFAVRENFFLDRAPINPIETSATNVSFICIRVVRGIGGQEGYLIRIGGPFRNIRTSCCDDN